tara:strand:+ start:572 stop:799 length:228 start_codon:yes stop_codon:yes gene_type:complete
MKNFKDKNKAITTGAPSDFVDGLYVQNGRLINDRPDGMMGIEKISQMRKTVKNEKNISEISQGIQRAKMMEKFMD